MIKIKNSIIAFFQEIRNYYPSEIKKRQNDMDYCILYTDSKTHKEIGIMSDAKYVLVCDSCEFYYEHHDKFYLFCMSFMETSLTSILSFLEQKYYKVFQRLNTDKAVLFPSKQIVKYTINASISEYWTELALNWYEEMEYPNDEEIKVGIKKIALDKKYSQYIRHRAFRLS